MLSALERPRPFDTVPLAGTERPGARKSTRGKLFGGHRGTLAQSNYGFLQASREELADPALINEDRELRTD
ncbi:hypothetical protein FOMPIDRAFT_1053501 [Fomitopsis schrenkii]|uniref:Uncharacterized protein n=1 Tax=Fomitopsis schrenkii TaxID=2126942 RepID=S8F2W6_FOMSC|nr:hypothetical protein FOMPIDRAFT_1053501 [Fomitopsis schrenkii]